MKKILVLLVAMIMCFGLCACGGGTSEPSPEEQILGTWSDDKEIIMIEAEGSGTYKNDTMELPIEWSYNADEECYELILLGYSLIGNIEKEDDVEIMTLKATSSGKITEYIKQKEE